MDFINQIRLGFVGLAIRIVEHVKKQLIPTAYFALMEDFFI